MEAQVQALGDSPRKSSRTAGASASPGGRSRSVLPSRRMTSTICGSESIGLHHAVATNWVAVVVAIALIWILTLVNIVGVRAAGIVQVVTTIQCHALRGRHAPP